MITGLLVDRIRVLTSSLEALVQRRTAALEAEVAHRSELERAAAEITNREQQRIAHELHDELGAFLAGIAFRVKALAEVLDRRDAPEMADARSLVGLVNGANDQVRGLAHSLAPLGGWDRALGEVLSQLGREVETTFGITCAVEVPATVPGLTAEHTSELFRIAREAIRNAVKHSKAREVEVSVCVQDGHLQLKIACDGERWQAAAEPTPGLGLRIMRHRTKRLEGTLAIKPLETGGALVCCTIPVIRLKTPSAVSFNRLSTAS
ncbi:MAG: histidine kinase [Verrucomicrobiota bacterium]